MNTVGLECRNPKGSSPTKEKTPSPVKPKTPSPVKAKTPTPVKERTPSPVKPKTPTPVKEKTPSPVKEKTPSPVKEKTPSPVKEDTPSPVKEDTPSPVNEDTPSTVGSKSSASSISSKGNDEEEEELENYFSDDDVDKSLDKDMFEDIETIVTPEEMKQLKDLAEKPTTVLFDPQCIRKSSNFPKGYDYHKFDNLAYKPEALLADIEMYVPKLHKLLQNIDELDKKDQKKYGRKFKHFIFSDIKHGTYGSKMLASALIAKGMTLGYTANATEQYKKHFAEKGSSDDDDSTTSSEMSGGATMKKYNKIELLSDDELLKTRGNNFYLLASISVYDQPIAVTMKKAVFKKFNERPNNVYGDYARIIIMDSGFKEGVDLFDVKYVHMYEPQTSMADEKQVIGRGTRTCGQKGLVFNPNRGWPLYVFKYDLSIGDKYKSAFSDVNNMFELYMKYMNVDVRLYKFTSEVERVSIYGSVDYELNKNIHEFSQSMSDTSPEMEGGAAKKVAAKKMIMPVVPTEDIINQFMVKGLTEDNVNFHNMRKYIRDNYSEYSWDAVKMENMCGYDGPQLGGASTNIKFSPTQDFIRNYFTPQTPVKGMLLWASVGTGKTCSAIATATSTFEPQGYTILWVTRTTLKSDIWKNMFDQVCSEQIRQRISNGEVIPDAQGERMRLLSKSWKIRPMSYKQFSNLVSKQNRLYTDLVKINGEEDPLRKTLLIIDEAHKLYGGEDLSSIERPNMEVLHAALMRSYAVSGANSVRLLLMTATPITQNPMELIKLVNLCKLPNRQMPTDFEIFAKHYLDDNGAFTPKGQQEYLDDIAGHISYLNRERDARQFSQPIVKTIYADITDSSHRKLIEKYDKDGAQAILNSDIYRTRDTLLKNIEHVNNSLGLVTAKRFAYLEEKCELAETPAQKKACKKTIKNHIKDMVQKSRDNIHTVREEIKEMREQLKTLTKTKTSTLTEISKRMKENPNEYEQFLKTQYSAIKKGCGKRLTSNADIAELIKNHPAVQIVNSKIDAVKSLMAQHVANYTNFLETRKLRVKALKDQLKQTKEKAEKVVLNALIKNENNETKLLRSDEANNMKIATKKLQEKLKPIEKQKTQMIGIAKRTLKKRLQADKKEIAKLKKDEAKLEKLSMKSGKLTDVQQKIIQDIIDQHEPLIDADIKDVIAAESNKIAKKIADKENKKKEKQEKKDTRKAEMELKKQEKLEEQANKKKEKEAQREAEKTRKKQEKLEEQARKKAEKAATRKNKK